MSATRKNCYVFVFDGFADYEVSLALAGIARSESLIVKTIALSMATVKSASGVNVLPDTDFKLEVDLKDIDGDSTAMLILPGGNAWESNDNEAILPLVRHCLHLGIPIAAMSEATLCLAHLRVLNRIVHTSHSPEFIACHVPDYAGHHLYVDELSVRTKEVITAGSAGFLQFAWNILDTLEISSEATVSRWLRYNKRAVA